MPDYVRALEELGEEPPHEAQPPPSEHIVRDILTPANLQHRPRNSSSHGFSPKGAINGAHSRETSTGTTV